MDTSATRQYSYESQWNSDYSDLPNLKQKYLYTDSEWQDIQDETDARFRNDRWISPSRWARNWRIRNHKYYAARRPKSTRENWSNALVALNSKPFAPSFMMPTHMDPQPGKYTGRYGLPEAQPDWQGRTSRAYRALGGASRYIKPQRIQKTSKTFSRKSVSRTRRPTWPELRYTSQTPRRGAYIYNPRYRRRYVQNYIRKNYRYSPSRYTSYYGRFNKYPSRSKRRFRRRYRF